MSVKLKWIGFIGVAFLLLTGCEESSAIDVNQTKVESESEMSPELEEAIQNMIPESVRNGIVTKEVYLEVIDYKVNHKEHSEKLNDNIKELTSDGSLFTNVSFVKQFNTSLDQYDSFLEEISMVPETNADFELNNLTIDAISKQQIFNSDMRKYIDTQDNYYLKHAQTTADDLLESQTLLLSLMKEYGLQP